MPVSTLLKTPRTLIAAGTSVAAGTPVRGASDQRTTHGGILTVKITNGATGPTVQAVVRVLIAHDSGATPATGAAGATWKTIAEILGGGVTANAVSEAMFEVPPGVMHFEVEIGGNTGQAVTGEAFFSEVTSVDTV